MTNFTKGSIIKGAAVTIDVAVPLAATFNQFPIWVDRSSEATMSGLFLIFAFLSCLPFIKQIKAYFKSPSSWVVWTVLLIMFISLRNIVDEMIIVCFFGMVANLIGTGIYKIGEKVQNKAPKVTSEESENNEE